MSELRNLLELWKAARAGDEEIILVTVVRVEGSSYRKPGARMLLTKGGRRSGMISGGCLEAEVSRKAWWLTESGPSVQKYGTFFDEDNPSPQELGCGGTVHLLIERGETAATALEVINESAENRLPYAMLTVVKSAHPQIGLASRFIVPDGNQTCRSTIPLDRESSEWNRLLAIAAQTLEQRHSEYISTELGGFPLEVFAEYISPPPALFIFGAGDDAIPVVEFAHALGWLITVADLRPHLATNARFPHADRTSVLTTQAENNACTNVASGTIDLASLNLSRNDAAVVMTHSYTQDRALLRELLPLDLAYLGLLGPRLRASSLIREIAEEAGMTVAECKSRLHSPVGLNLGADGPSGIALSIVAEVQAAFHADSGLRLRGIASSRHVPFSVADKIHA